MRYNEPFAVRFRQTFITSDHERPLIVMNISFYLPFASLNGIARTTASAGAGDEPVLDRTNGAIRPDQHIQDGFSAVDHDHIVRNGFDGMALYDFLCRQKHVLQVPSTFCSRLTYLKPWQYARLVGERKKTVQQLPTSGSDAWLSCHCDETAPDLLGPYCCERLSLPYIIYQPLQTSTDRQSLKTYPGFLLNRCALQAADLIFTNWKSDYQRLRQAVSEKKIHYLTPRIFPEHFAFDLVSRHALREQWSTGERRIVLTAAMLRPGGKTIGVQKVIDSCAILRRRGLDIMLIVAGDGLDRALLEREGQVKLPGNIIFLGKIPRAELYRYYSAADVFAFPGIRESHGMVYLEAQAAGLPVVAFADWGAADTVIHQKTGLLAPAAQPELFTDYLEHILIHREIRVAMREAAKVHIRTNHDALAGYLLIQEHIEDLVARRTRAAC
ncbi:MAG: glycosyltransferase family 4 protein [Desulfofustis sp.]|nr:glycosyltransferase family 4 protein [Desulfofustis sp.]